MMMMEMMVLLMMMMVMMVLLMMIMKMIMGMMLMMKMKMTILNQEFSVRLSLLYSGFGFRSGFIALPFVLLSFTSLCLALIIMMMMMMRRRRRRRRRRRIIIIKIIMMAMRIKNYGITKP